MYVHPLKQSLILGLLFFILTLPFTYEQTDKVFQRFHLRTTFSDRLGLPTLVGSLSHAIVFMVLCFGLLVLKPQPTQPEEKIKIEKPNTIVI